MLNRPFLKLKNPLSILKFFTLIIFLIKSPLQHSTKNLIKNQFQTKYIRFKSPQNKTQQKISNAKLKIKFPHTENPHASGAKVMLLMVVPAQLLFLMTIQLLQAGHTTISIQFVIVYLVVSLIQVSACLIVFLFDC